MDKYKYIVEIIDDYQKVVALEKKDNILGKISSSYSNVREHHIEKITVKHTESESVIIIDDIINIHKGEDVKNEKNKPMSNEITLTYNVINSNEGIRSNESGGSINNNTSSNKTVEKINNQGVVHYI